MKGDARREDKKKKGDWTLFDAGQLGSELALVKSIFETLGTPDNERWPVSGSTFCWMLALQAGLRRMLIFGHRRQKASPIGARCRSTSSLASRGRISLLTLLLRREILLVNWSGIKALIG